MIQRLSHTTVYVLDQEEALKFYRDKLGLEVNTDVTMDNGFRWLTMTPKGQPGFEIALMAIKESPMCDAETAATLKKLVTSGKLSVGVFETPDCRATYEELKKRGVEFQGPPEERFYGIEAIGKDNSGNWFSMTQHLPHGQEPKNAKAC
jgi:catechol 2,3-dioxygenase-like lactoylglutathione lyase family enzyme